MTAIAIAITAPAGIIDGLPEDDYHASPDANYSRLKNWQCPKKMLDRADDSTAAKSLGRATHCAVLEPERFEHAYAVYGGIHNATHGAYKEALAKAGGRILLKPDAYDEALWIRDAVHADPESRALLEGARRELSIFWTDEETGIECRARLDVLGAGPADLKRAANGSPHGFRMAAAKYGYAIQAAHYLMGCHAVGLPTDGFRFPFVAIEPNGRHPIVSVYDLDDDSLQRGMTDRANALRTLAECRQTNVWPGYVRKRTTIRLPYYALVDNEEE